MYTRIMYAIMIKCKIENYYWIFSYLCISVKIVKISNNILNEKYEDSLFQCIRIIYICYRDIKYHIIINS